MLRKSPVSAAIKKKTLELFKSYKIEYILTFFVIYDSFLFSSLLMVVPSSVSVKPN